MTDHRPIDKIVAGAARINSQFLHKWRVYMGRGNGHIDQSL